VISDEELDEFMGIASGLGEIHKVIWKK